MRLDFNTSSMQDYQRFLKLKSCPVYHWEGTSAVVPNEYADMFGGSRKVTETEYRPIDGLFDYQRDITETAIRKKKYSTFIDCGYGKTLILLEFARHAAEHGFPALIVSPLMVVPQTIGEAMRFYGGKLEIKHAQGPYLQDWLNDASGVAITNYESIREGLSPGKLGCLVLDESSMLKSHYGKWGTRLIELGRGLEYKLCCTGTPAPNDRIEFANHAVFCDVVRSVNEFLARYFVNTGKASERWSLKKHALKRFYRELSHWSIFLSDPSVYGWQDNTGTIPPIQIHIEEVPLTPEQRKECQKLTGGLVVRSAGGISQRSKLSQIARGSLKGKSIPTNKPQCIRNLVDSWPDESTITWCHYNEEQDLMERTFPEAGSIRGNTKYKDRLHIIDAFKSGQLKGIISKPRVLGLGLNLQVCTRQVFNGLRDSYEEFYQAIKRSNRINSTRPLNVHIPITEIEEPMMSSVLAKASRVDRDTREQEELFKEMRNGLPA